MMAFWTGLVRSCVWQQAKQHMHVRMHEGNIYMCFPAHPACEGACACLWRVCQVLMSSCVLLKAQGVFPYPEKYLKNDGYFCGVHIVP